MSRNAVARQIAEELQSVTWVVSHFFLREALHEVELSSTFRNGLQQLKTQLHSVSPLQQLFSQFTAVLNVRMHAHTSHFSPPSMSIARQVAEKTAQCNRALTPNFGNLQSYTPFSNIATQVAEKIVQCNRVLQQTLATYNATFSSIATQVVEKISQCNRALTTGIFLMLIMTSLPTASRHIAKRIAVPNKQYLWPAVTDSRGRVKRVLIPYTVKTGWLWTGLGW